MTEGAKWAYRGEGVATRKWDGTCAMVKGGLLYKRYDAKNGKTPPAGFVAAQPPDEKTGHWPGWLLVGSGPEDKYFREAWTNALPEGLPDGTYELLGPKIGRNAEGATTHHFRRHGDVVIEHAPRDFNRLKEFFEKHEMEGLVFHHPDGRMVKIKASDFGVKWPRPKNDE